MAFAVAMLAAVVLSACGSSGSAPVSAPPVDARGSGDIVFIGGGPSAALGVDNTDLLAATPSGQIHDLTSSAAAESDAAWSADGTHVVFVRQSTTGRKNGAVASQAGLYTWAPGHGSPRRIASCSRYCPENEFAWSPDDRQIAFVSYKDGLEVMNADGSGIHVVCARTHCGEGVGGPIGWSPDGRKLVFSEPGSPMGPWDPPSSIWIANADGSGVEQLTQANCNDYLDTTRRQCSRDTAPAWSPDGRLIAFSRWRLPRATLGARGPTGARSSPTYTNPRDHTSLEVMRADGSHVRSIYDCNAGDWCDQSLEFAWAPDGKSIAYTPTVGRAPPTLRVTTLAGKTTTLRTCAGSQCLSPSWPLWSPNGEQLTFIAGGSPRAPDAWVINRDGSALHRIATGVQWGTFAWVGRVPLNGAKGVPTTPTAGHLHLSGTILYDDPSGGPDSHLHLLTFSDGRLRAVHLHHGGLGFGLEPAWSPDGRQIAFGATRATTNTNVYVADANGKNVRVLTRFHTGASQPTWSPDGRTIAFTTDTGIELVPAAGGPIRSLVTGGATPLRSAGAEPSWNPTGDAIVFDRQLGGQQEALYTIRSDGSGLRRVTNLPGEQRSPTWSPDGKEIAFEWWSPGGEALYLIRPDGTHLRRVTPAAVPQGKPAWSPDSRYLLVMDPQGVTPGTRVSVIDVRTGRMTTVGTLPGYAANPSWSSR